MNIKVERSGGITGTITSNQLSTEDLSPSQVNTVKKLIDNAKFSALTLNNAPQGAADHYSYKITIRDRSRNQIIECNQYNMGENLKSLVNCVEDYSRKRKRKN